MASKWSPKDPNDIADYWFDWSAFLPEDENVTAATVTVPVGLTGVAQDFTDKVVRIRLSGGALGKYISFQRGGNGAPGSVWIVFRQ